MNQPNPYETPRSIESEESGLVNSESTNSSCPSCGASASRWKIWNTLGRKYCKSCGATLAIDLSLRYRLIPVAVGILVGVYAWIENRIVGQQPIVPIGLMSLQFLL